MKSFSEKVLAVLGFAKQNAVWIVAVTICAAVVVAAILTGVIVGLNGTNGKAPIDSRKYLDRAVDGAECDRECFPGQEPKVCRFSFQVELFNTMSKACHDCPRNVSDCYRPHCITADGLERVLTVVNREMPGPPVAVCVDDIVIADVYNNMPTESFTVHWHGEHMRDGFQYMDGVPHVTQCPTQPGATFRYTFPAKTPGSHFWHSHLAFQRGDGAFGAFIVRDKKDPNADQYDRDLTEHFIFPQEWFNMSTRDAFILHTWDTGKNKADNLLINGRGLDHNRLTADGHRLPPAVFEVEPGLRHRFRVASPGFTLCPIQVAADGHDLTVIASEAGHLRPMTVGSFVINPGERFDFVLHANRTDRTTFAMRFVGLFDCAALGARSAAIIRYTEGDHNDVDEDNSTADKSKRPRKVVEYEDVDEELINSLLDETYDDFLKKANGAGPVLNALNYAPPTKELDTHPEWIPITRAKSFASSDANETSAGMSQELERRRALLKPEADKVFYLGYDLYARDNPKFHHKDLYSFREVKGGNKLRTPQMNNVTLRYSTPPLLSQIDDVDKSLICSDLSQEYIEHCGKEDFCSCIYTLNIDLDDVVEIVLIDEGVPYDVSHPFHMHGNDFYVVAMERHVKNPENIGAKGFEGNNILRTEVMAMDKAGKIPRNLSDPPRKDTVTVPDGGFTVVRFLADNPGFWLMHCHMSWHNKMGMGFVLKVGDVKKDVPPPPKGFPKCNDFF